MKKFNLKDYNRSYVMSCKTNEEAEIFAKFLHKKGMTWSLGGSYLLNNRWDVYKEEMAYNFNDGTYGTVDFFANNGFSILNFSDFDWSDIHTHSNKEEL